MQREVEVLPSDTEESLAERVKKQEHILYPIVIDMLSSGEIKSP